MTKANKNFISFLAKYKLHLIVAGLVVVMILSGIPKFLYNYARCGNTPIQATTTDFYGGQSTYWLPGNYNILNLSGKYFCSETEAQSAGYEKSVLQR